MPFGTLHHAPMIGIVLGNYIRSYLRTLDPQAALLGDCHAHSPTHNRRRAGLDLHRMPLPKWEVNDCTKDEDCMPERLQPLLLLRNLVLVAMIWIYSE